MVRMRRLMLVAATAALLLVAASSPAMAAEGETGGMWDFFSRFFGWIWEGMRQLAGYIGQALSNLAAFLGKLLQPLWDFLGGLIYLLGKFVDVIIMVIKVFLLTIQVLFAVIGGLMRTFVSLATFDPAQVQPDYNPFAGGTNLLLDWFHQLGGDVIPLVLSWVLWLLLARALLKLWAGGAEAGQTGE